jgi:hypothetical protein
VPATAAIRAATAAIIRNLRVGFDIVYISPG